MHEEALARTTDPQTSHEAAAAVNVGALESLVLRRLHQWPLNGMTCSEIAAEEKMQRDSISPRMRRLVEAGLVSDSGDKRVPRTGGRKQIVWKITPAGHNFLRSKNQSVPQSDPV